MTITVIGATGQQGSAVVDALREQGAAVRAVTRNPKSDAAAGLVKQGAEVVAADLNDRDSVRRAFDGAEAAFVMTTFAVPDGTDGEVVQGRTIAAAAEDAQVPFLVYSSVGGAERETGIPHFESKRRIEEALQETNVPVAFVRPTFFMENLSQMIRTDAQPITVGVPMPDGIPLQMVSVRDIGKASAAMLLQRDSAPKAVEIAGDELTGSQMAELVSAHLGAPATYPAAPLDVLGDDEDLKAMFRWLAHLPAYEADFDATRRLVPDLEDLAAWLQRSF
jgi:uncharacterized protein YbjT (DUF2867 family)